MSNFLQSKEIHLTLINMHTRISSSLTTSSSFSFESITKYLNISLGQNKAYLLSCFSVPFINDIAYMLSELGITEENEFVVEYEEIDTCNQKIQIVDNVGVFETNDAILYGNDTGLYKITETGKEMIYEGDVNEIASYKDKCYITNNKNHIVTIEIENEKNKVEDNIEGNKDGIQDSTEQKINEENIVDSKIEIMQKNEDTCHEYTKDHEIDNKEMNTNEKSNNANKVVRKCEIIVKSEEKIRKVYVNETGLYYATINGNIYRYNVDGDKLIAENIREVTCMKVKDNKLYVSSLANSFLCICLSDYTITYIVKNFPATAFIIVSDTIYLSGTTGIAKIIGNEASTFEVNIRFTDAICVWNNYIVFGGGAGVFVTHNNRLKSKILIEDEFRGIGAVDNILYVATKSDIRGYTLEK